MAIQMHVIKVSLIDLLKRVDPAIRTLKAGITLKTPDQILKEQDDLWILIRMKWRKSMRSRRNHFLKQSNKYPEKQRTRLRNRMRERKDRT